MIGAFSLFVLCQLVGEVLVRLARLPVPGPVIGLVLLLGYLRWRGQVANSVQQTARRLLSHLSLLFIPAGTGVMLHIHKLKAEWFPILAALVVGTTLTLIVTVLVFVAVARLTGAPASSGK
ncbi:MAG: CidA/LrgA family protein [Steroidobacteraceae bacterium]|jgi:holin-like protein